MEQLAKWINGRPYENDRQNLAKSVETDKLERQTASQDNDVHKTPSGC